MLDEKFTKWKGMDRKTIKWGPIIDRSKCRGCGMCFTSCGRNVYGFDVKTNKAAVLKPLNCMIGCTTCQTYCVFDAISFPDRESVREIIRKHGLLKMAKNELKNKLKSNKSCCGSE